MTSSFVPASSRSIAANALVRFVEAVTTAGAVFSGVIIIVVAVQVAADVASRTLFNHPLPATIDLVSSWWMLGIGFLAMGSAQFRDQQVRVTLALENGHPRVIGVNEIAVEIITGGLTIWMLMLAIQDLIPSIEQGETALLAPWMPLWPGRAAIVAGLILLLLGVLGRIILLIRSRGVFANEPGETSLVE